MDLTGRSRSSPAAPAGSGAPPSAGSRRAASASSSWTPTPNAAPRSPARSAPEFTPFLAFPVELRTIVYTTNAIESLNARFRKAVRHRGHFPNEQSALKVLYLVATQRRPNRSNPTGRINAWKGILNALTIHYGDRIQAAS
jgi:putative transposase